MMICPKCHAVMRHVYRFTPDRNCELDICKNCYFETKPRRLKIDYIEIMQDNTKRNKSEKLKKDNKEKKVKSKKRKKGKRNNVFRIYHYIKRVA